MKYKALIVEDEILNRDFLKNLLKEFCPEIDVAGTAGNVEEAVQFIRQNSMDIVFLDIELQTGSGFDVLQQVKDHRFQVIFTTAYDHYAVKAIRFSALDYLLKPINFEELQQAVTKAVTNLEQNHQEHKLELLLKNLHKPSPVDFSVSLATSDGIEYVPLSQIIRLEAKGPYTTFFLKRGQQKMVCKNLKEYELSLTEHGFFRIHNSYIINIKEVKKMIKTDGGYAVMNDDSVIAISPRKRDEFMLLMSQRLV